MYTDYGRPLERLACQKQTFNIQDLKYCLQLGKTCANTLFVRYIVNSVPPLHETFDRKSCKFVVCFVNNIIQFSTNSQIIQTISSSKGSTLSFYAMLYSG